MLVGLRAPRAICAASHRGRAPGSDVRGAPRWWRPESGTPKSGEGPSERSRRILKGRVAAVPSCSSTRAIDACAAVGGPRRPRRRSRALERRRRRWNRERGRGGVARGSGVKNARRSTWTTAPRSASRAPVAALRVRARPARARGMRGDLFLPGARAARRHTRGRQRGRRGHLSAVRAAGEVAAASSVSGRLSLLRRPIRRRETPPRRRRAEIANVAFTVTLGERPARAGGYRRRRVLRPQEARRRGRFFLFLHESKSRDEKQSSVRSHCPGRPRRRPRSRRERSRRPSSWRASRRRRA